jgi:hypothetical protein
MYKVYNKKTGKLVQIISNAMYEYWTHDTGIQDVPISDYNCINIPEGRIQVVDLVREGEY